MANELSVSVALRFIKGATDIRFNKLNQTFTVSGVDYISATQSIATSETALDLGGCAAGGTILIANTDATNYVSGRAATGGTNMIRLNAGEVALFRFDAAGAAAPYFIANTGAVIIAYLLVEP